MAVEQKRKAFDLVWWPIDLAVAWVLTRDRIFVESQWRRDGHGFTGIEISLAVDQLEGRPASLQFPGVDDAWTELKKKLEQGAIPIVGTPFRREAELLGHASETSESQRQISDAEIGSLMLDRDGDDLCLIPEDWRVARGSNWQNLRGYRNVQVSVNGVTFYFPVRQDVPLPSRAVGPPENPSKPGWMSVSNAAYWIASNGGAREFDFRDTGVWKTAFDELLPRIASGIIGVIGRHHRKEVAEAIDGVCFSGIDVYYPYSETSFDLTCGERPYLQCYGVVDTADWQTQLCDCLFAGEQNSQKYSHLQVKNSDLAREFPFTSAHVSKPGPAKPKLQAAICRVARELWPNGDWPRVKERNSIIRAKFSTPPDDRTIRRALNEKR